MTITMKQVLKIGESGVAIGRCQRSAFSRMVGMRREKDYVETRVIRIGATNYI